MAGARISSFCWAVCFHGCLPAISETVTSQSKEFALALPSLILVLLGGGGRMHRSYGVAARIGSFGVVCGRCGFGGFREAGSCQEYRPRCRLPQTHPEVARTSPLRPAAGGADWGLMVGGLMGGGLMGGGWPELRTTRRSKPTPPASPSGSVPWRVLFFFFSGGRGGRRERPQPVEAEGRHGLVCPLRLDQVRFQVCPLGFLDQRSCPRFSLPNTVLPSKETRRTPKGPV